MSYLDEPKMAAMVVLFRRSHRQRGYESQVSNLLFPIRHTRMGQDTRSPHKRKSVQSRRSGTETPYGYSST